jgi:hypothetical protein
VKCYRIKGTFYTLIKSYLEGRYHKFIIANSTSNYNTSSNWMEIKHGVPQGSILGPLFFLIHINDLPTLLNRNIKILLYTFDTCRTVNSPNS